MEETTINTPPQMKEYKVENQSSTESNFPKIFLILSILFLGITLLVVLGLFTTAKQLFNQQQAMGTLQGSGYVYGLISSLFVLPLCSLFFAISLKRRQVASYQIATKQKALGVILLIITVCINSMISGKIIYQLVNPIYSQMTNINLQSPSITPSSDTSSNWKTYTNTIDGFSFHYPSTWNEVHSISDTLIAEPNPAVGNDLAMHVIYDTTFTDPKEFFANIMFGENPTDEISKPLRNEFMKHTTLKTITIDGRKAYVLSPYDTPPGMRGPAAIISDTNRVLVLLSRHPFNPDDTIFDHILSTFTFKKYTPTISGKVLSPDKKQIAYLQNADMSQALFVSNMDGSDRYALISRNGPDADSWGPILWSPQGTYIFLQVTPPDSSSFYVFKRLHTPFQNGKPYLQETSLNPIGGVYTNVVWLSDTKLKISRNAGVIDKKLPDAILDLTTETYTEVK